MTGGKPLGIIVYLHGFGEYAGKYGWYAKEYAKMGFDVYAFDYKGHGFT